MYKMIVVDDSELTRKKICTSVNWALMDIEIVGEASDGLEAMMLIHDIDPDILICDIRMPKLDGIALVNEVQPSRPSLQVLFLSGYSDKEYLKNAIKLNAVDYLYKPVQLHELTAAVEKAKKRCESQKIRLPQKEADLAFSLMQRAPGDPEPPDLPIDLHAPMITVILRMNTANDHTADNTYDNRLDDRLIASRHYIAFDAAASRVFDGRFVMSCVDRGYILHANVPEDFLSRPGATQKLRPLLNTLDSAQADVAVGVSDLCTSSERLRDAYDQAHAAVRSAFLTGWNRVILFRNLSAVPFAPPPNLQNAFLEKLNNHEFTAAIRALDDCIDSMKLCREQDIPVIRETLASLAYALGRQVHKYENQDQGRYISEFIHFAPDLDTVRGYLLRQIQQHIDNLSKLDDKGRIVLEVEQYILQNYDKDLSVRDIAQRVFITPNYLCYLYKKNTGRTLNAFILGVKMEKASKMLRESNRKIGEISDALGYANQNYFTRLFTKYFGESPRVYRNKRGSFPLPPDEE